MNLKSENLLQIRRDFHRFPELGFKEKRTKDKIIGYLKELGLDVHSGVGIVGVLRSGEGNKVIGLRADMDALPIRETNTHDYVSNNTCLLYTSPSPRDRTRSRMPSSA